jgi:hypothetical protein
MMLQVRDNVVTPVDHNEGPSFAERIAMILRLHEVQRLTVIDLGSSLGWPKLVYNRYRGDKHHTRLKGTGDSPNR